MTSATFPARLREALENVGGIRGVAASAGLTPEAIRLFVAGEREPKIGTVERLALAIGVDPSWLAFGKV